MLNALAWVALVRCSPAQPLEWLQDIANLLRFSICPSYCLKLFQKLGPTICCMPITFLGDCRIRRSYLAKLFLHIHSPIFNSHGSACSWVITSHSSSLHPVGNRTWTKSSMIRKHKKNAEQYSLTFHLPKGHLICPAWAAKSMLPKVLCRDIIRSEYPWQQSSDSEEP